MVQKKGVMFKNLKLLLPVIMPSWRFFDVIAPSPRIEFAVFGAVEDAARDWREYRPHPKRLSFMGMMRRLVWNPHWNESLFLMSCAERIVAGQEAHSKGEIMRCMRRDLGGCFIDGSYFQFRLVFIARDGEALRRDVAYISPIEALI